MSKSFLLYLPVALTNESVVGGQVTAARGIYEFINKRGFSYDLVDSVGTSGSGVVVRRVITLTRIFRLFFLSLICSYRSSLFFYSTIFGLALRFVPALLVRAKGGHAAVFFRNSSVMRASELKIKIVRVLLSPYATLFVQGSRLESFFVQKGFGKERVMVVPNWLTPGLSLNAKVTKAEETRPLQILFTGQITDAKGIFELIEAIGKIEDRTKMFLTIIGDGDAKDKCIDYCIEQDINNINILDPIPHDLLMRKLKDYDVFVLPSHSEGFPNSVLEAMASGLAVIVTDVGEIKDSVINNYNGFLVPLRSPPAIGASIKQYMHDRSLLVEHSENAMRTVRERHGWEKNCQRVCDRLLIE